MLASTGYVSLGWRSGPNSRRNLETIALATRAQWLRVRRILVLTRTVLGLSSKGAIHD
jgi:hypothetical protein